MTLAKALATALFFLAPCSADSVKLFFTNLPAAYENGTYNGFATAKIDGIPNQLLICDDYDDTTYMPSSSNLIYDYSMLTGPNPLQYAMFATSTPAANQQKYDEAAVLVYQLDQLGSRATADELTDYNYALWNLMNSNVPLDASRVSQELALQTNALAMVNNSQDASFLDNAVYLYTQIYTPTAAYAGNQEFVEYSTPEPKFGWALAAIFALAFIFRRRLIVLASRIAR